jgi:hypothetical protein
MTVAAGVLLSMPSYHFQTVEPPRRRLPKPQNRPLVRQKRQSLTKTPITRHSRPLTTIRYGDMDASREPCACVTPARRAAPCRLAGSACQISKDNYLLLQIDGLIVAAPIEFRAPHFVHSLVLGPAVANRRAKSQVQVPQPLQCIYQLFGVELRASAP